MAKWQHSKHLSAKDRAQFAGYEAKSFLKNHILWFVICALLFCLTYNPK